MIKIRLEFATKTYKRGNENVHALDNCNIRSKYRRLPLNHRSIRIGKKHIAKSHLYILTVNKRETIHR